MIGISDIRTVPVGEDLTTENLAAAVVRGYEKMFRVDKKLGTNVSLLSGEYAVLNDDNTLSRPGATPVANTYLVLLGSDRFDVKATGQATLVMNSSIMVKSNKYDAAQIYTVGAFLTAKDRGLGQADLTLAANGEYCFAKVAEVGSGYLVYELIPTPFKKA
jgi:hypothetical protein